MIYNCDCLDSYNLFINEANTNNEPIILSRSYNMTVHANKTIKLPCIVKHTANTIVIWNQCDDVMCNKLRIPLTINKENFIEDLRFRILYENFFKNKTSDKIQNKINPINSDLKNNIEIVKKLENNKREIKKKHSHKHHHKYNYYDESKRNLITTPSFTSTENVNSWTLEIRKFSKKDEGCYQCQLNSFQQNSIYYCLKIKSNN